MRLFFFLLFILSSFISLSQEKKFELKVKQMTLLETIKQIENRYNTKFSYSPHLLQQDTVTLDMNANTESELIEKVFENASFKIKKSKEVYLIIPSKKKQKKAEAKSQDTSKLTVQKDQVKSPKNKQEVISDTFTPETPPKVPRDTFGIQVSAIKYQNQSTYVSAATRNFRIQINQDSLLSKGFLESAPPIFNYLSAKTGYLTFNTQNMSQLPSLGQTDVFKSMQLIPGIRSTDETQASLVIRGANPAQNLIVFDGFTIYHVDHFFGIFSTFNPMVIRDIDLYKGAYGAEFGGRLSSITYIHGKAPAKDKFHASLGLYMTSTDLKLETPIGKKMSWLAGLRISNSRVLTTPLYKDFLETSREDPAEIINPEFYQDNDLIVDPTANFYDFYSKFRIDFSKNGQLDVNLYASEDTYQSETSNDSTLLIQDIANWSNLGFSTNWRKYFNERFYQELVVGVSAFSGGSSQELQINQDASLDSLNSSEGLEESYSKSGGISDMTIKYFLNLDFDRFGSIDTGFEQKFINTKDEAKYNDFVLSDEEVGAALFSPFVSYKLNREKVQVAAGLRFQYYPLLDFNAVEPRIGLNYNLTREWSVKSSYNVQHQFIHQLSLSPFSNSDLYAWVLADGEQYPIQSSRQFVLGSEFRKGNWLIDLEAYRNLSKGILESDFLFYNWDSDSELDLIDFFPGGTNLSVGMDVLLKFKSKRYESWMSYTLSRSESQMENGVDVSYLASSDQRHEINLSQVIKYGSWEFSSVFIYGSGRPYTSAEALTETGALYYELEEINENRLPAYHRLDVSAKYTLRLDRISGETGLTFHNIYNRKNVKSRRFYVQSNEGEGTSEGLDDTASTIVSKDILLLGFTPNIFLRINI